MLQSTIDSLDPDPFLETLSVVDQEDYKSTIQLLDSDDPMFYWTFRNTDFKQWNDPSCSQVLWLSGPPERNIHQVSSYIVDLEKKATLKTEHIVLYFFCSSAFGEESIVDVFVHTLLHQIVRCSPMNNKISIFKRFLHTLLKEAFKTTIAPSWEKRDFNEKDSPNEEIKKILKAPADELWAALKAALDCEQERELSVIVDGLDNVKHEKSELIRGVHAFVEHLQQRTSRAKILLTSQPQAEIKEVFGGFPCIEYDKERKG